MTSTERTRERAGLSETEVREVRSLIEQCHPVDVNIILEASEGYQFLRYQGGTLVGVLGVRHDGEACLCVAPVARRRGIGRGLIVDADEHLTRQGICEMIVECDASSTAGKAFLSAMQGTARTAEFRLRLSDPKGLPAAAGKVHLEPVGPDQITSFARRSAVAFGHPSDASYSEFERQVGTARHRFYVASVLGSVVGGIRVTLHDAETHLTSFHTVAEARRKGYGRDLLLQICRALIDEGRQDILLEVRTNNEAALELYQSCGFDIIRRYDFYERRVVAGTLAL